MAETFTLSDAYGSIDLLDTGGLNVLFGGGSPQRAVDPDERVIDTYSCKVVGTSDDDLAAQLIALNRILENAARYDRDSTEENEVWLTDQLAAETNARRTLVLGGSWTFDSNPHSVPTSNEHTAFITLAIKHMAGYEGKAFSGSSSTVTAMGGAYDVTGASLGDIAGRARIFLQGATGTMDTIWLGFRSARKHILSTDSLSNFKPIWEVELGTLLNGGATSGTYNSTCTGSGNKAVEVTFGGNLWNERLRVLASEVAAGKTFDQTGRFIVLGRMRLDAGTDIIQVRLQSGWYSAAVTPNYKVLDPVTVSGTDFKYYELGTVKFPPVTGWLPDGVNFGVAPAMENAALSLLAANLDPAHTSKLVIDHFALVPIDEGFLKISGAAMDGNALVYCSITPKGLALTSRFGSGTGAMDANLAISQQNFAVPFGSGRNVSLYVFGQRSGLSVVGDTIAITAEGWNRFYALQGNP